MKKIFATFLVAIAVLGVVAAGAGFANNSADGGIASYEPAQSEILVHYGNDSIEVLTPGMPEFDELWDASLNAIRSIEAQLRCPVPYDLKERMAGSTYVEVTFPETTNISITMYDRSHDIELDGALIMLSGCRNEAQIGCKIFTGKRGYTNWTGDTGYFVPDSSKDVKYMGVYVANVTEIKALKELLGISEPESPKPKPEIVLEEGMTLPDTPDKTMVYKVKSPEVTTEKVVALAEALGLGSNVTENDEKFIVSDDPIELEVLKASGRVAYADLSEIYGDIGNPPDLPSTETAVESAREFLSDKGLMPVDAEFRKVVTDFAEIARKDQNTSEISIEKIDLVMQVMFSREIDGIPVVGAGSKLKTYIGDNGDVVGVYKCWREYEPYEQRAILTSAQALERLKEKGIHGVRAITGEKVTVKEVYLAYYAQPAVDEQEYLQPVFVFEVDTGRGEIIKQYIPALQDELEELDEDMPSEKPQYPERANQTMPAPDESEDNE